MKTTEIGEFGLIERLSALLPKGAAPELLLGIGDDAAAWKFGDRCLLATTDTMVEDEHFDELADWSDVGWKVLSVNLSDIAAMGGTPIFGLITIGVRPRMRVEALDALYAGISECAERYSVAIVGGDVVRARQVSVTIALIGEARMVNRRPLLLRRGGARIGDAVAVTGTLGDSGGGLRQMQRGLVPDKRLARRHYRPEPRLSEGSAAVEAGIRCGIDVSDGLLQDLAHICEASGTGAVVRWADVPVSQELLSAFPRRAAEIALTGGEDYELVLVGKRAALSSLPVTIVGEIVEGAGVRVMDLDGREIEFEIPGWDQLRV